MPSTTPAVAILRTLDAVDAIADEWRALEARTPEATGFQSFDWCRAWMCATGDAGDLWRVLAVRDGGRLVALWPLQRHRMLGARVLGWLGEPWTQYGDVLVEPGPHRLACLAAGWREIAAWDDVDVVKLGRVRADAAIMDLPGFLGRASVHRDAAPFAALHGARPRPEDKRLRARRRKLEAIGPVSFAVIADPDERRACVRQAVAMKRAWLGTRGLASSGLWHPSLNPLMDAMADSDALIVGRLQVGAETAALELGLRSPSGFRSLLGCHDARFAGGSPGHLLIGAMIEWCRAQGLPTYDLMVPADDYKRQWADGEIAVVDYVVTTRLRGRLAAAWLRNRPALKTLYARMPTRVRSIIIAGTRRSPGAS